MHADPNLSRLDGRHVVASVSGGKDSTAMCLHLRERGIPFEPVFMDTGWEAPETYAYLRDVLPGVVGSVRWLRAEVDVPERARPMVDELEGMLGHYSAMVRTALRKAVMPARTLRWCTQEMKVKPMQAWLDTLDADVVNAVGIRADESAARAALDEWEWAEGRDLWSWRPLIRWTVEDVVAIHQRHGVAPNPLYYRGAGASRVGCYPCIFARKAEIRGLSDARVEVLRRLEEHVGVLYRERTDQNNTTYASPTWFQHNSERTPEMAETGYAWPIDRVREWASTARGGRQVELFAARPGERGCMRWGLCEVAGGADD